MCIFKKLLISTILSQIVIQAFLSFFRYKNQMNKFTNEIINIDDYEDENNEKNNKNSNVLQYLVL